MRFFSAIMAVIIMLFSFVSNTFKNIGAPKHEEPSVGGWTVNARFGKADIPEGAEKALDKANGKGFTPVAYLGSQVVSGTNYAFLCTLKGNLYTVRVYRNLKGNCKITDTEKINIADYTGKDNSLNFNPADYTGGWYTGDADGADLPADAEAAFGKATDGLTGIDYDALALLGSQVVAGRNYAVLCKAETADGSKSAALAVMIIYADLSGGARITSISNFDF